MIIEVLGLSTATDPAAPAEEVTPPEGGSAELNAVLTVLKGMESRLNSFEQRESAKQKASYIARAKELGACGMPAKNVELLLKQGEKNGWELSAFDAFDGLPGLKLHGQTKHLRDASPNTDDADAAARRKLGLPEKK